MKYYALALLFVLGCASQPGVVRLPARESAKNLSEDNDVSPAFNIRQLKFPTEAANDPVYEQKAVGMYSNADTPTVGQFLESARRSIDIEIYEMEDPDIRKILRRAMSEKKVQVRIIKEPDPIGEKCFLFPEIQAKKKPRKPKAGEEPKPPYVPTPDCIDMRKFVDEVNAQNFTGPKFVPFNKEQLCGQERKEGVCFQHGKLIIVDKKFALISTGNFNSSSLCNLAAQPGKCNRDFSYITRDPEVLRALNTIFEKDLLQRRYSGELEKLLNSGALPDKLTVSPYSFEPLAKFLNSATKRIQIENQYIRPDSDLAEILIEKAQNNVEVELLLADSCYYGIVSPLRAKDDSLMFAEMEKAGVKIKMFTFEKEVGGLEGYLHAKVIVVDGSNPDIGRAWIGSVNGSDTSLNQNREFGIFFNNDRRVRATSEFLAEDFNDSTLLTWRDSIACHSKERRKSQKKQIQVSSTGDDEDQTPVKKKKRKTTSPKKRE